MMQPALAQTPAEALKRLEAYIDTPDYRAYVTARLNEFEPPPLRTECAALKFGRRWQMWVTTDAKFAGAAAVPSEGQWMERLIVDRCGAAVYRNVTVVVKDQKPQAHALLPGRTNAGPLLQRDALKSAAAAARIKTGCQDAMAVSDTGIDGKLVPGSPWKEDWTFLGCGKTVVVGVDFRPDGRGGTKFTARAK